MTVSRCFLSSWVLCARLLFAAAFCSPRCVCSVVLSAPKADRTLIRLSGLHHCFMTACCWGGGWLDSGGRRWQSCPPPYVQLESREIVVWKRASSYVHRGCSSSHARPSTSSCPHLFAPSTAVVVGVCVCFVCACLDAGHPTTKTRRSKVWVILTAAPEV